MPGIVNIGNSYDNSSKKSVGRLSFDVGETFSARIVDADESGNEVVLRLPDGWKFPAQLSKSLQDMPQGTLKFQVTGIEDGKIQIQVVQDGQSNKSKTDSSIEDVIRTLGLDGSEDEYSLLLNMVKHDMPLTKENITQLKTITEFKDKIKDKEGRAQEFINKYLSSKGISPNSEEGKKITAKLQNFFDKLRGLSEDDLITLMENGVKLTGENIESFNRIFKGEGGIYNQLKQIKNDMENIKLTQEIESLLLNDKDIESVNGNGKNINFKDILKNDNGAAKKIINQYLTDKGIDVNNDNIKSEINILDEFLNQLKNSSEDGNSEIINRNDLMKQIEGKDILKEIARYTEKNNNELKVEPQVEKQQNTNQLLKFKDILKDNPTVGDRLVSDYLSSKGIDIKSQEAKSAVNVIDKFLDELKNGNVNRSIDTMKDSDVIDKKVFAKEIVNLTHTNSNIKNNDQNEILRTLIRNRVPLTEDNIEELKTMLSFKDKLNDDTFKENFVKVFMNARNIDADGLKSTKLDEALNSVLKEIQQYSSDDMVSFIKTASMKNNSKASDKAEVLPNDIVQIKSEVLKDVLKETINLEGKNIKVSNSTDEIKQQISIKTEDMKQIIKQIVSGLEDKSGSAEKVLAMLQDNVSDFKLFNSISNNYYYVDVPINLYNNEYQCKLIIKDDRKSGKSIDSKNVKVAASVKTVNMGVVDAYIKVLNRNVKIDIKCDEKWMRPLDLFKEKIQNKISDMSYNVTVDISKKENDLNIVECREFFGSNDFTSINTLV